MGRKTKEFFGDRSDKERALQFPDQESFLKALTLADRLAAQGPYQYDLAGRKTIVLPRWCFGRLQRQLKRNKVPYSELKVMK